jgi:hypothetical protein
MVRRSFRIGLWIGLLLGVGLALRRTMQLRRGAQDLGPSPEYWPPIAVDDVAAPPGLTVVDTFDERIEEPPLSLVETPAADADEWAVPPIDEPIGAPLEPHLRTPQPAPPLQPVAAPDLEVVEPPSPAPPAAAKTTPPVKAAGVKKARPKKPALAWVEPEEGVCPQSHPVKAKLSSGIFHLPGMFAYDRTKPDRCYASPDGAEADGLTRAKR